MSRYLSVAEVLEINAEMARKFGGTHAIRDNALLESAAAQPQSGYYEDIFEQAAALFESLSQNHPFVDEEDAGRGNGVRLFPFAEWLQIIV